MNNKNTYVSKTKRVPLSLQVASFPEEAVITTPMRPDLSQRRNPLSRTVADIRMLSMLFQLFDVFYFLRNQLWFKALPFYFKEGVLKNKPINILHAFKQTLQVYFTFRMCYKWVPNLLQIKCSLI